MSKYGNNIDLQAAVFCGILAVLEFFAALFSINPLIIGAEIFSGVFFAIVAIVQFVVFLRDKALDKNRELADIVRKCRFHPDKDIEDVVREAASGAKYWTFKTAWRKLCNSHDFGRVFTAIYR